jgi:hypothetical protein
LKIEKLEHLRMSVKIFPIQILINHGKLAQDFARQCRVYHYSTKMERVKNSEELAELRRPAVVHEFERAGLFVSHQRILEKTCERIKACDNLMTELETSIDD